MKTNNKELADRIVIPKTLYEIENCNPNHILFKVLAKNLICWDSIVETKEYIYDQVPEIIRFIVERPFQDVSERFDLSYYVEEIDFSGLTLLYLSIIGGTSLAMG